MASNMKPRRKMNKKRPGPSSVTAVQPEGGRKSPIGAKRSCVANIEPNSANVEDGPTILDVLNDDCWCLILDQLPINDIVRSERVSRAWQRVVLEYLTGVKNYSIMDLRPEHYTMSAYRETHWYKSFRVINIPRRRTAEMFPNMIKKMGPFFVSMTSRGIDRTMLEAIAENCPNLKNLKIRYSEEPCADRTNIGLFTKCKQLKRVTFNLTDGGDSLLNEIVTSEALEELTISGASANGVSGTFLSDLKTKNLKTLGFILCKSLEIKNIVSAVNLMTGLTRLILFKSPLRPMRNVHLLIDVLPNLEHLSLSCYNEEQSASEVAAAIGRLQRLKELNLWGSKSVTDEWMEAAARGCPQLSTVNVSGTRVTGAGVVALCRARTALVELVVAGLDVTDRDMEACVRSCRDLKHLNVWRCAALTPRLPARLAWPRASPLRLRMLRVVDYQEDKVRYAGLIIDWKSFDYYSHLKKI